MKKTLLIILIQITTVLLQAFDFTALDPAVVRIFCGAQVGSGFVINTEGYIITNAHVVTLDVQRKSGNTVFLDADLLGWQILVSQKIGNDIYVYKASLINIDETKDLAVLRVSNLINKKIVKFYSNEPHRGDTVCAMGFPALNDTKSIVEFCAYLTRGDDASEYSKKCYQNIFTTEKIEENINNLYKSINSPFKLEKGIQDYLTPTVQKGSIEAIRTYPNWGLGRNAMMRAIQHTSTIRNGNSGGPLFNENGEVIAVNTIGLNDNKNPDLSVSSHASELIRYLESLDIKYTKGSKATESKDTVNTEQKITAAKPNDSNSGNSVQLETSESLNQIDWNIILCITISAGSILLLGLVLIKVISPKQSAVVGRRSMASQSRISSTGEDIKIEFTSQSGQLYKFRVVKKMLTKYGNTISVGRVSSSDIKIEDPTISKKHFSIISENGKLFIRDEGSTNGTFVDGVKLTPKTQTQISASSSIRVGDLKGKIYKI